MTLDAATASASVASGVATISWTLPAGGTQNGYRILVYRSGDIPAGAGATHSPVGGTRPNNVLYRNRPLEGDWGYGRLGPVASSFRPDTLRGLPR